MLNRVLILILLFSLSAIRRAHAQTPAEFIVPEGLEVTVWATTPHLYNPCAIDIDPQGRIWVAEGVNYRTWDGRNPGLRHPNGDRIIILEDINLDGVCDQSSVFAQEKRLVSPLGICILGSDVLVSCSPDAILYHDGNKDGVADGSEVFLSGFGGFDHDHGLHSFIPGPDGRLYVAVGNAGPHIVKDRSDWSLRSGSIYNDGGPRIADNKPRLKSDDGRIWTGGLVLRIDPSGTGLTPLAHNFRNNYEVAIDAFGNMFQNDNDDDGSQGCRTLWVMTGGNHGYFSSDGSRYWQADRRPGQSVIDAHWHQNDPGVVPAGCINGGGGPTGVAVYEGALMSRWLGGAILNCDAGRNVVYAHMPSKRGAGISLEKSELLKLNPDYKNPKAHWFRPSDVCVAPDGAIFVSDWWDPGVGGHAAGDGEARGRILRIAPKGYKPAKIQTLEVASAIQNIHSPNAATRYVATVQLCSLGAAALKPLAEASGDRDDRIAARAMFPLARIVPEGREYVLSVVKDINITPERRIAAFRSLLASGVDPLEVAAELSTDADPGIRREVAVSIRGAQFSSVRPILKNLAAKLDVSDRYALEAFGIACDGHEDAVFALLDSDTPGGIDPRVAWRLHSPLYISKLLADIINLKKWNDDIISAIAFTDTPEAAELMFHISLAGTTDQRNLALFWLRHRSTNSWRDFPATRATPSGSRDKAKLLFKSDVIRSGVRDVSVDVAGATQLWLVVSDAGDGNSCDWANWINPTLHFKDRSEALSDAPWISATAEWGSVSVNKNCVGGPLRVDKRAFEKGIGTHASSEIAFPLSPGAARFSATIAPDDGGARQIKDSPTSIIFEIYAQFPEDRSKFDAARGVLLAPAATAGEVDAAIALLGTDPEGGHLLVSLAAAGRLNEKVKNAVAEIIFNNPDLSVRGLASRYFKRVTSQGTALPSSDELLKIRGDERRGLDVFFGDRAACSKCHSFRGRGGDVGPDLTQIRKKYQKGPLLDAILNPTAAIAFGFDTWVFTLKSGAVKAGFLLADGEDVIIKDTQGHRVAIPKSEIVDRQRQTVSSMPEGIALGLEPGAISDLLEFLSYDYDAPPRTGPEVSLFNGKDLDGWTSHLGGSNLLMEDVWSVRDGVITCKGNPAGYIRTKQQFTNYILTLEWRFEPSRAGNSGVLLRMTGPDKVWPRSIEAQLMDRNAGDIWNIDEFPMVVDSTRTEGRRTMKLHPCSENPHGEWNRYVITVNRGSVRLEVNGILQNTASWCAEIPGFIGLQSEGAGIRFRNIKITPIL